MDAHDFVTVSTRREVALAASRSPEDSLRSLLSSLVQALREGGCTMVGHIKGMLEDGGPSPLFFSVTSLEAEPQIKGGPLAARAGLTLSITTIVAGIGEAETGRWLEDALDAHFG